MVNGDNATAIGANSYASTSYVAIGYNSRCYGGICVGASSKLGGNSYVALGTNANGQGSYAVAIGSSSSPYTNNFTVNAVGTAANQVVFGGSNSTYFYYTDVYIGGGVTNPTPLDTTYHATSGSGTNINGAALVLAGGQGTGSAAGGEITFKTSNGGNASGTTLRTLRERMRINANGTVIVAESLVFDAVFSNTSGTTITIDWNKGNKQTITLAHNVSTINFTAPAGPASLALVIKQDGTGSRTVTGWPAAVKWPSGTAPTFSTTASAIDAISCLYDGSIYLCQAGLNFQ